MWTLKTGPVPCGNGVGLGVMSTCSVFWGQGTGFCIEVYRARDYDIDS